MQRMYNLGSLSEDYLYLALNLDPIPQRLKPLTPGGFDGGAEEGA